MSSIIHSINQTFNQIDLIKNPYEYFIYHSFDQTINEHINQSINQPINQ